MATFTMTESRDADRGEVSLVVDEQVVYRDLLTAPSPDQQSTVFLTPLHSRLLPVAASCEDCGTFTLRRCCSV